MKYSPATLNRMSNWFLGIWWWVVSSVPFVLKLSLHCSLYQFKKKKKMSCGICMPQEDVKYLHFSISRPQWYEVRRQHCPCYLCFPIATLGTNNSRPGQNEKRSTPMTFWSD